MESWQNASQCNLDNDHACTFCFISYSSPVYKHLVMSGVGLGQVLLQESQVLVGTGGTLLSSLGGNVLGSGGRGSKGGLKGIELGELGG
jgi:hypothetical protein